MRDERKRDRKKGFVQFWWCRRNCMYFCKDLVVYFLKETFALVHFYKFSSLYEIWRGMSDEEIWGISRAVIRWRWWINPWCWWTARARFERRKCWHAREFVNLRSRQLQKQSRSRTPNLIHFRSETIAFSCILLSLCNIIVAWWLLHFDSCF